MVQLSLDLNDLYSAFLEEREHVRCAALSGHEMGEVSRFTEPEI